MCGSACWTVVSITDDSSEFFFFLGQFTLGSSKCSISSKRRWGTRFGAPAKQTCNFSFAVHSEIPDWPHGSGVKKDGKSNFTYSGWTWTGCGTVPNGC